MPDQAEQQELDPYVETMTALERDLDSSGFSRRDKPAEVEPCLPVTKKVRQMTKDEVSDLYDECLSFHGYLANELAYLNLLKSVTEVKLRKARATAKLAVSKDRALANADAREAAVELDEGVQEAEWEHLQTRALADAHEERRRNLSKTMDRLWRELQLRDAPGHGSPRSFPNRPWTPR
jgi:hypothetical protein